MQTRTSLGWLPVRKDLDGRLYQLREQFAAAGTRLGPEELVQYLAAPYVLPHYGLGYRVTDVSTREHGNELRLGEPDAMDVPFDWTAKSQEEYTFCRRQVQDGPVALAALWLARKPDEVRDVLDWVVNHSDLLRGETTWQDRMALMLGRLTEQEQEELSRILRDRLVALGRQVPGRPAARWAGAGLHQAPHPRQRLGRWRSERGAAMTPAGVRRGPVRRAPRRRSAARSPRRAAPRRPRRSVAPIAETSPSSVSAMERLMAANSAELVRADTKAAVFLAFTGAVLATFVPLDGGAGSGSLAWTVPFLRWSAVASALLAVGCFASALVPRHRKGRRCRCRSGVLRAHRPGCGPGSAASGLRAGRARSGGPAALGAGRYQCDHPREVPLDRGGHRPAPAGAAPVRAHAPAAVTAGR